MQPLGARAGSDPSVSLDLTVHGFAKLAPRNLEGDQPTPDRLKAGIPLPSFNAADVCAVQPRGEFQFLLRVACAKPESAQNDPKVIACRLAGPVHGANAWRLPTISRQAMSLPHNQSPRG